MSAIKTIRYEAAPGFSGEDAENDVDMDGEDGYGDEYEHEYDEEEGYDEEEVGNGEDWDGDEAGAGPEGYEEEDQRPRRKKSKMPTQQVLPIADLPNGFDFDGEPEDGATYLALAKRADRQLPRSKRVPPPVAPVQEVRRQQPVASGSRHPALPAESWTAVFPIHFKNYREHIRAEWPPAPRVPYPKHMAHRPRANVRGDIWQYIHGCRRKYKDTADKDGGKRKRKQIVQAEENGDDEEAAMNGATRSEHEDDEAWGIDPEDQVDEDDEMGEDEDEGDEEEDEEEAAMNNAPPKKLKELEEETDRHRPHDPLISVMQLYTSSELIDIIGQITTFITETLDRLSPFVLVRSTAETAINPFPELYMRWLFACLVLLDDRLDGDGMSSLRDLARAAMKVAAWRWIRAVTDGEVTADQLPGARGVAWRFGDTGPAAAGLGEQPTENGLEETLGRCWIIFHAVVHGWAQRDLLDDLEHIFR